MPVILTGNFCFWLDRVRIRLKILYSNYLFIHHETEVGIWFYIVKHFCTSKMSKMWSILLRDTVEYAPWAWKNEMTG